jgi:hypothetical protein
MNVLEILYISLIFSFVLVGGLLVRGKEGGH